MKSIFIIIMLLPLISNAGQGYGVVTLVKGQVEAVNSAGQKRVLKIGDKVFESETVITQKLSAARLAMMDTNIIEIYPSSNLKIQEYTYNPKEDQKNVSLEVLQGRIKSTVKQKYDNDKNKYNVKTPVIVAGVRGTTFSTEHNIGSLQSRVITFEGNVLVGKRGINDAVKEFFSVKANQSISIDQKPSAVAPKVIEVPKVEQEQIKLEDKKEGLTTRQPPPAANNAVAVAQPTAPAAGTTAVVQQPAQGSTVKDPVQSPSATAGTGTTTTVSNTDKAPTTGTAVSVGGSQPVLTAAPAITNGNGNGNANGVGNGNGSTATISVDRIPAATTGTVTQPAVAVQPIAQPALSQPVAAVPAARVVTAPPTTTAINIPPPAPVAVAQPIAVPIQVPVTRSFLSDTKLPTTTFIPPPTPVTAIQAPPPTTFNRVPILSPTQINQIGNLINGAIGSRLPSSINTQPTNNYTPPPTNFNGLIPTSGYGGSYNNGGSYYNGGSGYYGGGGN